MTGQEKILNKNKKSGSKQQKRWEMDINVEKIKKIIKHIPTEKIIVQSNKRDLDKNQRRTERIGS